MDLLLYRKMKKHLLNLTFLFLACQVNAQVTNQCIQAVNDQTYQSHRQFVLNQFNDNGKLQAVKSLFSNNCYTSNQLKDMAQLFQDDYIRLEFAKPAYQTCVDKQNFYEVYNAFHFFSNVFKLHDYVLELKNNKPRDPQPNTNNPQIQLSFPPLNYPPYSNYSGTFRCNYPMNEPTFGQLALETYQLKDENSRLNKLKEVAIQYCLATQHLMKLTSLLSLETNRLTILKKAVNNIYDWNNYGQAAQLLTNINQQNDFLNFIKQQNTSSPVSSCVTTDQEFSDMVKTLRNEAFSKNRLTLSKTIIRAKKCFTTKQIKEFMGLFNFDDERLELAQFAYDYVTNQDVYYLLSDAFSFSSSKENFQKFLESKH